MIWQILEMCYQSVHSAPYCRIEVINYIGEGKKREDIAAGVVDSVAAKVSQLAGRKNLADKVILTGGLSNSEYFTRILSEKLGKK